MVNYICPRCNYTSKIKTIYTRHLRRKNICLNENSDCDLQSAYIKYNIINKIKESIIDPLVNQNNPVVNQNKPLYKCKYCGKKDFSYKQSLSRHEIHRCKKNINNNQEYNNLKELVNLLNDQLLEQKKELKSQKEEHQKQINELIKKTGINIGTQNIQNNIKILAYKNTDISHLTDKDYLYCSKAGLA